MALTRIKTNQITDLAVTTAKIANNAITAGKLANNITYGSDLTVSGNLTVSGTTVSVSTTNTRVDDAILSLAASTAGSPSEDAGILINRGSSDNYAFLWDESADQFVLANVGSEDGDTAGNVTISAYANAQLGTLTYATLNDGSNDITATAAEINLVDGSTAGTIVNSKAVIYGASGEVNATTLQIGGTSITSTAAELNFNDGATAGTVVNSKTVVYGASGEVNATTLQIGGSSITATAAELNILDGVTSTAAELNILDGVTSTAAEINLLDGSSAGTVVNSKAVVYGASGEVNATTLQVGGVSITSTPAELNILDGATLDVNELNLLDGVTATTTELNYVDGVTSNIQTQLDAKLALAGGTMSGNIAMGTNSITGMADPTSNQDAATKAYVDSQTSAIDLTLGIAADSGADSTVTTSQTLTISGTANEIETSVSGQSITVGLPNDVTIGQDLTVTGNLTVNGTTTTLSTTNSIVSDSLIELNNGAGSNANDLGFIFERGSTGDNAAFVWDESADKFTLGTTTATGASTGNLTISAGTLVAALEGNVTGDVTGNADTASALSSAVTVALSGDVTGSATFTSAGDTATIAATIAANSVALGTDTTGNYVATLADAGSSQFTISNSGSESAAVTIALANNAVTMGTHTAGNYVATITGGNGISSTGATTGETIDHTLSVDLTDTNIFASDGTVSRAVVLDGSGDFSAGTITAAIDGIVGGNTPAAGTFTTLTANTSAILASAAVSDLTSGRVVLAGTSGELEDNGNLTFNGSTLAVTGAITASSNVDIADAGSLRVGTNQDFTINHDGTNTTIANGTGILAINGLATSSIRINEAGANVDVVIEGDTNTSLVVVDASGDNVGIGGAPNANAVFHVNDTGAMILPVGATADRPGTPVTGMFRYNSTSNSIEYYDNDSWTGISTDFTIATSQTFNGDDATTAFTLSALTGSDSYTVAGVLVMLNGIVQEPTTVYGISGTTLTFTTAPATGDLIEVRKFTTTTTVTALSDLDGDTLVQVEEGSDDDTIRFDAAGTETMTITTGEVAITGNLTVTGTQTSLQTTNTIIKDSLIELNNGASSNANDLGIVMERGSTGDNAIFAWDESADKFVVGTTTATGASTGDLTIATGTLVANIEGNVTGNLTGDVTGNADTASALSSAVTVSLTGDVTGSATFTSAGDTASITTTIAANSVALGTDTTGNYVATGATSGNGISGSVSSEGGTFTVTSNATSANTGSTIVFRDGSGNFSAGVITGTSTAARYADLAEMYAADEAIEPGTVVHFAGDGKVAACDVANCRAVAGIISTDPAHLMNSAQEGVALALAGRVPCKVTGPVAAGDLMVSAGNGMAMANNEAALGTVIGKAIEANTDGEGVIEVLALMM